jgi:alkylation response protein AidB-like acyl-CoA dehydrogenase
MRAVSSEGGCYQPTVALICAGSTLLEFDNVRVPRENLIGRESAGFRHIMSNFNGERLGMAIGALRLSRVCAEDAFQHAMTRYTFGQPLLAHGVIRAKFANFGALIEPAWAFLEQLVWYIEQNRKHPERSVNIGGMTALLKVMSTRTLESCVREAQQVMGGLGYSRGGKGGRIEQISRDVRMFVVGGGSEEIMTELALRQETEDLRKYASKGTKAKL